MILIHGHAGEAALKEVSGPSGAGVDVVGVAPVRLAHRKGQTLAGARRQNQVNVVGHQAIGPHLDLPPLRLPRQKLAIDDGISSLKEDRRPPVAALGHVVRKAWNHDSRLPGHDGA